MKQQPLKEIYQQIQSKQLTYSTEENIHLEHKHDLYIQPSLEHLVIRGANEQFSLSTFPNQPTLARYTGINSKDMINTIEALKLPRNHNNFAEFTFKFFNKHLHNHTGAAVIDKAVPPGKENHFKNLLRRLDAVYSNQPINHKFYATRLNEY